MKRQPPRPPQPQRQPGIAQGMGNNPAMRQQLQKPQMRPQTQRVSPGVYRQANGALTQSAQRPPQRPMPQQPGRQMAPPMTQQPGQPQMAPPFQQAPDYQKPNMAPPMYNTSSGQIAGSLGSYLGDKGMMDSQSNQWQQQGFDHTSQNPMMNQPLNMNQGQFAAPMGGQSLQMGQGDPNAQTMGSFWNRGNMQKPQMAQGLLSQPPGFYKG